MHDSRSFTLGDPSPVARATPILLALLTLPFLTFGTAPSVATTRIDSQTFSAIASEQIFTVPDGVTTLHVVAQGAPGADSVFGRPTPLGGRGALVEGDLSVIPGQTLYVYVGGAPTTGACYTGARCIGGYNGGGSSFYGGGGGGASDVRTVSGDLATRLVVAAGGGGGGTDNSSCRDVSSNYSNGGSGGDAGAAGGASVCGNLTSTGGLAGTDSAGGGGGTPRGGMGSLGQGGSSGNVPGAGGGGLYGGGGGGQNADSFDPDERFGPTTGTGGGGGGSNLVPLGGSVGLDDTRTPQIVFSWEVTLPDTTPPTVSITSGPTDPSDVSNALFTFSAEDTESSIASYACSLDGAPDESCSSPLTYTDLPDGPHIFVVTATDSAGNVSDPVDYSWVIDTVPPILFEGFYTPVDATPTLNAVKAGQTVPLRFRLTDGFGVPITNLASTAVRVKVSSLTCYLGTTSDAVEEYAAGKSGLQNLGDGYYQWNWKTPKSYAGSCKTLTLSYGESAELSQQAFFAFRK